MPSPTPARPSPSPDSFAEAVRWFRERLIMTDEEFAAIETASHDRAFTIAGVAQLDMVTEVWEAADRAVANGETLADFKEATQDTLTAAWGEDKPWRIETIYRTNLQMAYSRGRYEQQEATPAIKAARPFRVYSAIVDAANADCPICPPLDEVCLPFDHAWWETHWPPMHFNCRCRVDTLTKDEAGEVGVMRAPPAIAAMEGFGAAPAGTSWAVPVDLSEYPPELAAEF